MIKDTWKPRSRVLPSEWSDGPMDSWVISPQHFPWNYFLIFCESRFQTHTSESTKPLQKTENLEPLKKNHHQLTVQTINTTTMTQSSMTHDSILDQYIHRLDNHGTTELRGAPFSTPLLKRSKIPCQRPWAWWLAWKKMSGSVGLTCNIWDWQVNVTCILHYVNTYQFQNHRNIGIAFQALWKWNILRYYERPVFQVSCSLSVCRSIKT